MSGFKWERASPSNSHLHYKCDTYETGAVLAMQISALF